VLVWGGAFVAIKALVGHGLDAVDIAVGRYAIAAPGFAVALVRPRGRPSITRADVVRLAAAGLLVVTVYHLALNAGERTTTAGTAAIVVASAPGVTLALAIALRLERFSARRAAGLAVALAGVVVVILLGSGGPVGISAVRGPLEVAAAPLAFAAYGVLVKPLLPRIGAIRVASAASLAGTLALLPLAASGTVGRVEALDARQWALLVYLGAVCTLAGYIAWTIALQRLEVSRATAYLYGVPVTAIVIGAVTLGEPVTAWLVAGAAVVIAGVAVAQ
jgi:drug/metabolite transporter (DMT)-like permease